jgi:hypothetical protein
MARTVHLQERLRGEWRRGCSFEGRLREGSRVPLTRSHTRYNGWRGGVPSPHASTASGMVAQWPEWR